MPLADSWYCCQCRNLNHITLCPERCAICAHTTCGACNVRVAPNPEDRFIKSSRTGLGSSLPGSSYSSSNKGTPLSVSMGTSARGKQYSPETEPGNNTNYQIDSQYVEARRLPDRTTQSSTCEQLSVRDVVVRAFRKQSLATNQKLRSFITCRWTLTAFMRDNFERGQSLSDVVTLTGTALEAQAATCSDYISQFWPDGGSLLLQAVDKYLMSADLPG